MIKNAVKLQETLELKVHFQSKTPWKFNLNKSMTNKLYHFVVDLKHRYMLKMPILEIFS